MIYRWFWRCSSDPNTHSSLTVAPAEPLKSVRTSSRPADSCKMTWDRPKCLTAQLNTILKTCSRVCVCVCVCVCRWSGLTLIINHQLSHPESRWCGTIQPVSGFICSTLLLSTLVWRCRSSKPFFFLLQDRVLTLLWRWDLQVLFLCSKMQRTERSAATWEVFCFNCSIFIWCIKHEESGCSEILEEVLKNDKDSQILMEVMSLYICFCSSWNWSSVNDVQTPNMHEYIINLYTNKWGMDR